MQPEVRVRGAKFFLKVGTTAQVQKLLWPPMLIASPLRSTIRRSPVAFPALKVCWWLLFIHLKWHCFNKKTKSANSTSVMINFMYQSG